MMRLQDQVTRREQEYDYELTADVQEILASLRDTAASWIADEIEASIRQGRLTNKQVEPQRQQLGDTAKTKQPTKTKVVSTTVPYDSDEQLRLTLRALRQYFVGLFDAWSTVTGSLGTSLENIELSLTVLDQDNRTPLILFEDNYSDLRDRFDALLHRAWPEGTEPFAAIQKGGV